MNGWTSNSVSTFPHVWQPHEKSKDQPGEFYVPDKNVSNSERDLFDFIVKKRNLDFGRQLHIYDNVEDYEAWYRWSIENVKFFWEDLFEFSKVKYSAAHTDVLTSDVTMSEIPKWFTGCKLNYAENCLLNGKDGQIAFIQAFDSNNFKYYDYAALKKDVARISMGLRNRGVVPGDVVCGYLPNRYETSVAMLATATIGATWASASCDFGPTGVLDRFSQINPKVLFVTNITQYKKKRHSLEHKINEIISGLPSLEHIIVIPFEGNDVGQLVNQHSNSLSWDRLKDLGGENAELVFEQVPFDHPLFILFSSGTTGVPKGMVHTVGGTLIKHIEEHIIQENMKSSDIIFFYTTCGWMMWNWLMTSIFTGAAIVLYDESPLEPDPHVLLKICQNTGATILGMGAKIWDEYAKMNLDFKEIFSLSRLRLALSTGSPLKASTFTFINDHIRPKVVIGSISGGTDIVGCFVGCTLNRPVIPGECQHFYLGMDMCAFNSDGKSVFDEQGELVCVRPFPSMPSKFINDPTGERYQKAYFNKYNGVWTHGDYCLVKGSSRGVVISGRSDATLNRGGVRIGTAEIYNIVERRPEIQDSLVIGRVDPQDEDNEIIILFVKVNDGFNFSDSLQAEIKGELRRKMSPRHVPNAIYPIEDIPYTNSGKKVELAVKDVMHGRPVKNVSSIRNPEALQCYERFITIS